MISVTMTASCLLLVAAIAGTIVVLDVHHSDGAPTSALQLEGRGRGYNAQEYMAARHRLLSKERKRALGAGLVLNAREQRLNKILLAEKKELMERSRLDRLAYTPALSFFKSKEWMENTTTFKIIRKMPKGAVLHLHRSAMTSLEWLVKNITYRENVYMCTEKDGLIVLGTFLHPPNDAECLWRLVSQEREAAPSPEQFDTALQSNLSFLTHDPLAVYSDVNKAWNRFQRYFSQYSELNGTVHGAAYGLKMFKDVSDEFVSTHQDFIGTKVILDSMRSRSKKVIKDQVKLAMDLREEFPDFFLGYDLVGQEDSLNPLLFYLDALLYPTRLSQDDALPYFFHAGETKWEGTEVDENLVDALLLNATRIGHGYALAKHPELADLVKSRGVAVEVNPISNQLLRLVSDLRNHPMVPLLADDFPLVISSDDPAAWEALPLTHDFFVAFMDLSGQHMGLAFLKQLAINSFKYSALSNYEKDQALVSWQLKWDKFVEEAVNEFA